MTEVEGGILLEALRNVSAGRVLEVGTGGGRLTPYLLQWTKDVIASDATIPLMRHHSTAGRADVPRVGANVYHLPFAAGTFRAVTMVRVFGFLTDPPAALNEISRVLAPGGVLVLSVEPHPTLGSLVDDLKLGFSRADGPRNRPRTFSRDPVVPVRPSAYPAWSHTRAHVRRLAGEAGFVLESEFPCGLEDLAGFRRFPTSLLLSLSRALSRMGGFPSRFLVLRKSVDSTWPGVALGGRAEGDRD